MDDIKRDELENARKKIHKVRTRLVAAHMVRVFNMSVEKTVSITTQDFFRHATVVI